MTNNKTLWCALENPWQLSKICFCSEQAKHEALNSVADLMSLYM